MSPCGPTMASVQRWSAGAIRILAVRTPLCRGPSFNVLGLCRSRMLQCLEMIYTNVLYVKSLSSFQFYALHL